MMTQILLLAMIAHSFKALIAYTQCYCSEIFQQSDCKNRCIWSSDNSLCEDKIVDCTTTYQSRRQCDDVYLCAWKDSTSQCTNFNLVCSDYTVTVANQCYDKDYMCVPGTPDKDGKIPCKLGQMTCSSFQTSQE